MFISYFFLIFVNFSKEGGIDFFCRGFPYPRLQSALFNIFLSVFLHFLYGRLFTRPKHVMCALHNRRLVPFCRSVLVRC